jgi:hypothetical protein
MYGIFGDTPTRHSTENPIASERRGLFAFKSVRPAGRATKKAPIVEDALVARTRYSNSSSLK